MNVRFYSLIIVILFSLSSQAQLQEVFPPTDFISETKVKKEKIHSTHDKSVPCGIDTLYYSRHNNTFIAPRYLNLQPTRGAGMYFKIDDTITLYGFNYFGYATNANGFLTSQNVTCKVYYASSAKLPAGVALASGTSTVNASGFNLSQLRHTFLFTNPIQLVSDFVITVEFPANLSNRIILTSNDYNADDGMGKQYSSVRLGTNWSNNLLIDTVPFDADFYLEPVVEYKMKVQYDHGFNSCLGNGKPFEFVNTTTFALNPQFSKEALDSTIDDNFIWDYGDGTKTDTMVHGLHSYTGTLGYYVNLDADFKNWRGNTCRDDSTIFLEAGDVQANYSYTNNGLLVVFKDKSTNATKWEWDFGDGSPISIQQNPSHLYAANGTYVGKLKARDRGCVDSLNVVINLEGVGVEENEKELEVSISPNPASDEVLVVTNITDPSATWEIYNIHGKVLEEGFVKSKMNIDLRSYSNGIYFIQLKTSEELITKRIIVQ